MPPDPNSLMNKCDNPRLTLEAFSVICGGPGPVLPGADVTYIDNKENLRSPRDCYQEALDLCDADILLVMHDDVTVYEALWENRVLDLFEKHPDCVAVGLGGAIGLGSDDIYKKPYNIMQMARRGYVSNATDWKTHGGHERGEKRVAVIEAFFMAVRAKWLRKAGGWPKQLTHHGLDMWLGCEAVRQEKTIWMTGCHCDHWGGRTSTTKSYAEAKWLHGQNLISDHESPHAWLYSEYRDCLPIRVPEENNSSVFSA